MACYARLLERFCIARHVPAGTVTMILPFRAPTDFQIDVPSDFSLEVRKAIGAAMRRALDHITGVWKLVVRRTRDRGRWRLELRGATGRHIWTVLARPETLADAIVEKLETFVRVSATHWTRALGASFASH
jgi:hypothetical protein